MTTKKIYRYVVSTYKCVSGANQTIYPLKISKIQKTYPLTTDDDDFYQGVWFDEVK